MLFNLWVLHLLCYAMPSTVKACQFKFQRAQKKLKMSLNTYECKETEPYPELYLAMRRLESNHWTFMYFKKRAVTIKSWVFRETSQKLGCSLEFGVCTELCRTVQFEGSYMKSANFHCIRWFLVKRRYWNLWSFVQRVENALCDISRFS